MCEGCWDVGDDTDIAKAIRFKSSDNRSTKIFSSHIFTFGETTATRLRKFSHCKMRKISHFLQTKHLPLCTQAHMERKWKIPFLTDTRGGTKDQKRKESKKKNQQKYKKREEKNNHPKKNQNVKKQRNRVLCRQAIN